jgi:hypothetical protein
MEECKPDLSSGQSKSTNGISDSVANANIFRPISSSFVLGLPLWEKEDRADKPDRHRRATANTDSWGAGGPLTDRRARSRSHPREANQKGCGTVLGTHTIDLTYSVSTGLGEMSMHVLHRPEWSLPPIPILELPGPGLVHESSASATTDANTQIPVISSKTQLVYLPGTQTVHKGPPSTKVDCSGISPF